MNHQDHTRGYEPVRPDEGRPRSRWRWWAVGLAGMTGLALATIGVAAPAADAVGRPLTSADEQPSADERRSGGESGKGESVKGESGKGEPGKAESGKGDPGRGESGRGESDKGKGKQEPKPKGVPVPCDADKLIAAITLANARGGAVLDLAKKCTYLLTATIDDGAGLPVVTAPITLNGGKHTTIKRAAGVEEFRIVTVGTGGDLTLNHLTLTGGQTDGDGGGILVNAGGALTTNHSTVTRNIAGSDGGGSSGGIANNGTTTIKHSTVSRNTAATAAGGIGNTSQLAIKKSSVTANMANAVVGGFGGGVGSFPGGTTVVTGSTISGNHAGDAGGGAGGFNANVTVTDTAITGNRASNGGAVFAEGGMLALRHVTVTNNTATLQGGGLSLQALNAATVATVADSTIAHNVGSLNGGGIVNAAIAFASTLDVRNTHITANQATFGGGIFNIAVDATVTLTNTKVIKNIAISTGGGILNSGGTVNLNTATGTVVVKNRPNNCVNVPGCVG
ncbi:right-handed parallel beta-helix repeat-containing protein [Salinispora arenicola]|uniref:right-handed parallel beta-helix repeat-containing protein n=1 Tax=Salinispora arenicola TaxID=168697 RepID=UPI00143013BA|nr:right-handed parallel beta-helix repeat-containing protein [Salinispora arenicola]NIL42515.1 right-handed parallel beta-helix repeat-containing protein [Salinispora arenicola]